MYKWHAPSLPRRATAADLSKVADGIASSLRQFSLSSGRDETLSSVDPIRSSRHRSFHTRPASRAIAISRSFEPTPTTSSQERASSSPRSSQAALSPQQKPPNIRFSKSTNLPSRGGGPATHDFRTGGPSNQGSSSPSRGPSFPSRGPRGSFSGRGGLSRGGQRGSPRGGARGRGRGGPRRNDRDRGGKFSRGKGDGNEPLNDVEKAYLAQKEAIKLGFETPAATAPVDLSSLTPYRPALALSEAGLAEGVEGRMRELAKRRTEEWIETGELGRRFIRGEVVMFDDEKERDAVLQAAKEGAEKKLEEAREALREAEEEPHGVGKARRPVWAAEKMIAGGFEFSAVEEEGRTALVKTVVEGNYSDGWNLAGHGEGGVVGEVRRLGWKNRSVKSVEGRRIAEKVKGFVVPAKPVAAAASKGREAKPDKAKAKIRAT